MARVGGQAGRALAGVGGNRVKMSEEEGEPGGPLRNGRSVIGLSLWGRGLSYVGVSIFKRGPYPILTQILRPRHFPPCLELQGPRVVLWVRPWLSPWARR